MIYIGVDTETALIAPGRRAPPLACMTACIKGSEPRIYLADETGVVLEKWLRDDLITLVIHNAKFDMGVFQENYPWLTALIFEKHEKGLIRCTLINRVMYAIAQGTYQTLTKTGKLRLDLASLVLDVLGEEVEGKRGDTWRFKYRQLIGMPLEEWPGAAVLYAKRDAWYHIRIFWAYNMQEPFPDELNQVKYAFALHLMYSYGFRADPDATRALEKKLTRRVERWGSKLEAKGLCTWLDKEQRYKDNKKPQRAMMIAQCDFNDRPVPRTKPTEKMKEKGITEGNIQLKKDLLVDLPCHMELGASGCDFDKEEVCHNPLHWIAFISEDKGELSKYVKWLKIATTTPVNSRVSTCIATGRVAVSQPPTQQLPRRSGVRECIVPRPGFHLIGADYNSNELVTLAQNWIWLFGESKLAELLQKGISLHDYTGALIKGIPYEEFLALRKVGDRSCKDYRQLAKALNFGLPGGMGAGSFVDYCKASWGLTVTLEEAQEYKRQWKKWFPEAQKYFDLIGSRCEQGGGQFRYTQPVSGRLRGGLGFCDGCNTPFQGLAADMAKNALWWVTRECFTTAAHHFSGREFAKHPLITSDLGSSFLYGCKPLFFQHDEIILEAPIEQAAAAADRLAFLMEESSRLYCPDVPGKAEPWITERWYKDAETKRNEDGVLVLWTP